jgi:hypothetical protein
MCNEPQAEKRLRTAALAKMKKFKIRAKIKTTNEGASKRIGSKRDLQF